MASLVRFRFVALLSAIAVLLVLATPAAGTLTAAASNSAAAKEKAPEDTAVFFAELDEPSTEGQRLVRALDPGLVWLAHVAEPWRPRRS